MESVKFKFFFVIVLFLVYFIDDSCKQKESNRVNTSYFPFDSTLVAPFIKSHPLLLKYNKELIALYSTNNFNFIWFDEKGIIEYGNSLYNKVLNIEEEGISTLFPYQEEIDSIFSNEIERSFNITNVELLISSLYLFYADNVYKGIDYKSTTAIGWLLPRKKISYVGLLDSIISREKIQKEDSLILFSQYYKLHNVLKNYREIEKNGGWRSIELNPDFKGFKPNDTAKSIIQIRDRLFITGEINVNNMSNCYDPELVTAISSFQMLNGFKPDPLISAENIREMNIPVGERIKTIVVNMERCRWISPEIFTAKEFIFVNIPSYEMKFTRNGKIAFSSRVVVGKSMTKTVIFSGKLSYLVFSPYWNLPKTIIEEEVIPGIAKNKNYLVSHRMEWNNGQVRQKPGKFNSLGLVKFIFPNSNDIYFHDSPSKNLYKKEDRALSHGCVRVERAKDLALEILKDDVKWTPKKVDIAMNAGKESICSLQNKIPVHIGYFTAWVDEQGKINFYNDVYKRDDRLAKLLYYKD